MTAMTTDNKTIINNFRK